MMYLCKFQEHTYDATRNAQLNLANRNCYVTTETLKFFNAKIRHSGHEADGFLFWIIESLPYDGKRFVRPVVFDVFGSVLFKPDIEESPKTTEKAEKMRDEFLESFDVIQHTKDAICSQIDFFKSNMTDLEKRLKHLEEATA